MVIICPPPLRPIAVHLYTLLAKTDASKNNVGNTVKDLGKLIPASGYSLLALKFITADSTTNSTKIAQSIALANAGNALLQKYLAFLILMIALTLTLYGSHACAANINLAWDKSTSNTALEYKIYYGTSSHNYTTSINAGNTAAFSVSGLQTGTSYYLAVTAFDPLTKIESSSSNEVKYTIPSNSVNFSATPTSGTALMTVTFQNTSIGNFTTWQWDFGDSTTSNAQNPVKVYATPGNYTVTLNAISATGTLTLSKPNFIQVAAPTPVIKFTALPTSGTAPLLATFTNNTTGVVNSWLWNFGDGSTSTLKTPTHTYTTVGNYTVTLTASGASTSRSASSTIAVLANSSSNANGLVAAYGFEEASGNIVVDASGKSNHGSMQDTTRISNGRFGKALAFDGAKSFVTINDNNSLDLATGMTLEAWVYNSNTSDPSLWGSVIWKETTGNGVYYLYGNSDTKGPIGGVMTPSESLLYGTKNTTTNTWVHLATTYDGQNQRLYVNGQLVSTKAQTGVITNSSGALRIGRDIWNAFFKGYIDEVRIYNRALTALEIISDLNQAVVSAKPPYPVFGYQALGSSSDNLVNGTALAAKFVADTPSMLTQLNFYLDSGTTSTQVIAGVYSDLSGHPDTLLSTGTLLTAKAGAWNSLAIPPLLQAKGTPYWIALMSSNGTVQFSDFVGAAGSEIETSSSNVLTTLPPKWSVGTLKYTGPISSYGLGY